MLKQYTKIPLSDCRKALHNRNYYVIRKCYVNELYTCHVNQLSLAIVKMCFDQRSCIKAVVSCRQPDPTKMDFSVWGIIKIKFIIMEDYWHNVCTSVLQRCKTCIEKPGPQHTAYLYVKLITKGLYLNIFSRQLCNTFVLVL